MKKQSEILHTLPKGFYIESSNLTALEGKLFLRDGTGHCHSLDSVGEFIKSERFITQHPNLVSIFKKAFELMSKHHE